MAITEITYSDKSDINTTSTPEINKITASNLNEIKSVVNTNANLMGNLSELETTDRSSIVNAINSTRLQITTDGSAIETGRVIDGNEEYIKRISLLSFPGINQEKTWATGINMTNIVITGINIIVKSSSANWFQLPNNDVVNSRANLNNDGAIHVMSFTANLTGQNGYAEITFYYQS